MRVLHIFRVPRFFLLVEDITCNTVSWSFQKNMQHMKTNYKIYSRLYFSAREFGAA